MSSGLPYLPPPAKLLLLKGGFNLNSDSLNAALCTSAQNLESGFLGASGLAEYGDLTAEVANGNGYTTGGVALTGVSTFGYVSAATVAAQGSGGTTGAQTVTGTTGSGTKFQASVTVSGGAISAVNAISTPGAYSALPSAPAAEPVIGGNLVGATLNLVIGYGLTFNSPSWTAATFSAKYLVIYDTTNANKPILAIIDLEETQPTGVSATNGTITYTVASNGLFGLA